METRFRNKYLIPSTRLQSYDYSSNGYYFITICTQNRENYFGKIINGRMKLSQMGKVVHKYWKEIPNHFSFTNLDEFVIMPNHIHGILIINHNDNPVETRQCLVSTNTNINKINRFQNQGKNTVSSIIGSYKSICTKTINKSQDKINFAWQPRFYDHIIRNELSLNRIREYIRNNPINWANDRNNIKLKNNLICIMR